MSRDTHQNASDRRSRTRNTEDGLTDYSASTYRPGTRSRGGHTTKADTRVPAVGTPRGSSRNYSRFTGQQDYVLQRRKRSRRKHILVGVLIGLAAVLLACAAGAWAYVNNINNTLSSGLDANFASVLTETSSASDPYYVLLMGTDGRTGETAFRSDTIMLLRIDPQTKSVSIVSIPRDTRVLLGSYGYQKINAAHTYGGATYAVQAVEDLTGVKISHYVEINFDGFSDAVDAVGGVTVDVPKAINDDDAGGSVSAGTQVLDGASALIFCRSRSFVNGDYQRQIDQQIFLKALAKKLLSSDVATLTSAINAMAGYVTTDMTVADILSAASGLRGMDTDSIISVDAQTWTTTQTISGISYVIADNAKLATIMKEIDSGEDPSNPSSTTNASTTSTTTTVTPSSYKIAVLNGSGISGCASSASTKITAAGFVVESTGNASSFNYATTLVVYNSSSQQAAAEQLVSDLGVGKAVLNSNQYTFTGDMCVIVGQDWKA
jgi:LCP family protein required for cell wall assembly